MEQEKRGWKFNKEDIDAMISLRLLGKSYPEIALVFHCDHTTVIYHMEKAMKNYIFSKDELLRLRKIKELQSHKKYINPDIKKGYIEYVKEAEKIKVIRDWQGNILQVIKPKI
jgi:hypothetical protein